MRHQIVGLGAAGADRLFDQHVDARFEKIAGDRVVQARRRGDHRGIEPAQQAGIVRQSYGMALAGHALAACGHRIDDGHQFHVIPLSELLRMEPAQSSRANHGYAKFGHGPIAGGW